MPPLSPPEVLRTWFDRVWNAGDESAIDALCAPAAVLHGLPGGPIKGPGEFKPFFRSFRSAFPDVRIRITHCVCEGSLCAVHCEVAGTHAGDGLGFPSTGKNVSFTGMTLARVEGGLIQEGWNAYDFLSLHSQLGTLAQL